MPVARRLPALVEEGDFVTRLWRAEDADVLQAAVAENVEHLRPWSDWIADEPMALQQRRALIREWEHGWENGEGVPMGIFLAGEVVGGSGYVNRTDHSVEIGYWVHLRHLRQGHATRAARLLTSAAFGIPEIDQVEIHHDKANVKSAGIPRGLGYRFVEEKQVEIRSPGNTGIGCTWVVTRQEWARLCGTASDD